MGSVWIDEAQGLTEVHQNKLLLVTFKVIFRLEDSGYGASNVASLFRSRWCLLTHS